MTPTVGLAAVADDVPPPLEPAVLSQPVSGRIAAPATAAGISNETRSALSMVKVLLGNPLGEGRGGWVQLPLRRVPYDAKRTTLATLGGPGARQAPLSPSREAAAAAPVWYPTIPHEARQCGRCTPTTNPARNRHCAYDGRRGAVPGSGVR